MSETNGNNGATQLDRLEASHVKLMTDYGLFVAEQREAWERHERFVAEQDRAWERQRERDVALDACIEKLISGIGEFMRNR